MDLLSRCGHGCGIWLIKTNLFIGTEYSPVFLNPTNKLYYFRINSFHVYRRIYLRDIHTNKQINDIDQLYWFNLCEVYNISTVPDKGFPKKTQVPIQMSEPETNPKDLLRHFQSIVGTEDEVGTFAGECHGFGDNPCVQNQTHAPIHFNGCCLDCCKIE